MGYLWSNLRSKDLLRVLHNAIMPAKMRQIADGVISLVERI